MSKSRRSLVRSTLFNLRQLWQRRSDARKEVRRSLLGTTFEQLEPRLAMAITSPLPGVSDHIHPVLQIYLEGQQVTIPTNVGITTGQTFNPHTHDLAGTIHIGEGTTGLDQTIRNTTLKDFFDIWSSATASPAAARNASAVLDTNLTDGTNLPRIMDKTVNPSTHVLRVYVKEAADASPELEYASNQATNSLVNPENYVPRDNDQIIISFDKIEQEANGPSFQPIPNQTVLGGAPTWLGIDGFDPNGGPLTYTVQSSNPSLLTATVTPATNKTLVLNVEGYGQMKFELFNDLAPRTTQHIETLVNNGEFATLAKFYRISRTDEAQRIIRNANGSTTFSFNGVNATAIDLATTTTAGQVQTALRTIPALLGVVVSGNAGGPFTVTFSGSQAGVDVPLLTVNNSNATVTTVAGANDFVIQGGPADTTSTLGNFDDEFHVDLQFTTPGLLAMAKSTDDTNDAQVFITGGPARFLDMNHSIFGVLTDGDEVRRAIQHTGPSGDGPPPTDIVISSAQIITDTENAALKLKAAEGASGAATVTLTVSDGTRSFAQTFNVAVTPDTPNSGAFLNPIAPVTGAQNQPITIQLSATDVENNAVIFEAVKPAGTTVNYTLNVNGSTGLVTITPPAGFTGSFPVLVSVRSATATTTQDPLDTQLVTVNVAAGAPTVDLAATSDSGSSSTDNVTNASSLEFIVTGVTSGATVQLFEGTTVLVSGTVGASANSISLTVPNPGTALGQGVSAITAKQTVGSQVGPESAALNVTFDSAAPTFTSTAPTSAPIGFDLAYNAQTNEEGNGVVYTLNNAPSGATINSTTGVVSFTPTAAQSGTQTFGIVATDAAGSPTTQAVTLAVAQPKVDFTVTLTRPDGTPLTSLTPNQDFVLHVFANDIRPTPRGVFSAYLDVIFDGTKATVTGPIVHSATYSSVPSGTTSTGLIDEAGGLGGLTPPGGGPKEVFSVPMRATAAGPLTFALDPEDGTLTEVLVYGLEDPAPVTNAETHFGSASITVGATFNAVNDAFNANEDTQNNTINPLANDASLGGATNTLTITAVGTTSNGGTVTITQNSTRLSYTPAANFKGAETFTYTARNQTGETQVGTVTMTVADVNDPPVATNDTFGAGRNSNGNVLNVLANDTLGVDTGETLRVTAVGTGSRGGTITIGQNGANAVYTPAANTTGAETFTYTVSDRATGGLTATATVTVNISALTANPDTQTVAEDSSATTIDVLANDALDPQVGGTLTITNVGTTSKGGTVSITQSGTRISYTPAANFQGTETFTYTISDGQGNNATSTVTTSVTNVNDPPVAANDTLTAFKNTTTTFDLLANDTSGSDPTENLVIDAVTQPTTGGTVSIVENGKKVSFAPTSGFSGATSFTYTIKDPSGATATATANVTVQDFAPSSLSGFVYFDVNNNGIKDAGESAITGVTITLTGTATAGSQTNVNQTMKTGDDGSYKFENLAPGNYTIRQTQPLFTIDGKDTAGSLGGTVSNNQIVISSLAQGGTGVDYNFAELGRAANTISLRDFFSSNSRNYAHAAFDNSGATHWHTTHGPVWNGFTDNSFAQTNNKNSIRYQGTNGSSQPVTKTLSASQLPVRQVGTSGSNSLYYLRGVPGGMPATNNQSPVGVADTYATPLNTALTVTAANGVLKNDTDAENNSLTAFVVTQPANGTLSLNNNGGFTFTPTTGFTGTTTFTYRASDGSSDGAATTVTINVGATNGVPTAVADSFNATEDIALTVTAANGVLKNDTDPENQTLAASVVTQPTKGSVTMAADGSFTYTPNANANGTDTFTYRATDTSSNQSAVQTVTITIAPVNDAPLVTNDTFNTTRNTALNQAAPGVLVNDTDVDGTSLTVTVTATGSPANGTLTLSPTGSFTYTPNNNFTGTDTFTYRASDGTLTADGVVTITVNPPANQAPVATADTFSTNEDAALNVTANSGVLGNDTDADNNTPLTAEIVANASHGNAVLNSNGTFTYTPTANFNGTDFFTYRAKDSTNATSTTATVTITVNSVNDLPVAISDTYETNPGVTLNVPIGTGLLVNDTDADGTTGLTVEVVNQPAAASGTLSLNANGAFSFAPANGFSGNATFTYRVKDPTNASSTPATVTIQVNAVPQAANDTYSINEDVQLVISSAPAGLLGNDTDANQDLLEAIVVAQPQNGTLTLNDDGTFTYLPNVNFSGSDTFTYKVNDGQIDSNVATVAITVNAVNDAPARTAGSPAAVSVAEDSANTTAVSLGLAAFTYGPGGGTPEATQTLTFKITGIPTVISMFKADGTTAVNANDTLTLAELQGLTYKTAANASGAGSLTWTVQDSGGTANGGVNTLTETLAVSVTEINDAPLRTAGSTTDITVNEDSANTTAVTLGLAGLTYGPGGGTAEASQTFTYKITAIPAFVALFKADGTTAVAVNDTLSLTELAGLKYKTVANASGDGDVTWTVQDSGGTAGGGIDTLTETLGITVGPVNDAPVLTSAVPADISVNEDFANTTAVPLGLSGLAYGPGVGEEQSTQTLAFTVTAIPAFIQVFEADGTTAVTVNDVVTLVELRGLTYKTVAEGHGAATLGWSVQDTGGTANGGVDTLTQTLGVTVVEVNDAPSFTLGANPTIAENAGPQSVAGFATNIDHGAENESGQVLTFSVTQTSPAGTLVFTTAPAIDAAGNLTYTVQPGTDGTATFSVVLEDNGSGDAPNVNTSESQSFTITVTPSEGEGEAAGALNDAALAALFASFDEADAGSVGDWGVSEEDWQDAVDAAMSQLG